MEYIFLRRLTVKKKDRPKIQKLIQVSGTPADLIFYQNLITALLAAVK